MIHRGMPIAVRAAITPWYSPFHPVPHLDSAGQTVLNSNPTANGNITGWVGASQAAYDGTVNAEAGDGTGSIKLEKTTASLCQIETSTITPAQNAHYTVNFRLRGDVVPSDLKITRRINLGAGYSTDAFYTPGFRVASDRTGQFVRGTFSFVTRGDETAFRILFGLTNANATGPLWIDDVRIYKGRYFDEAPATKQIYSGEKVRINDIGHTWIYDELAGQWEYVFLYGVCNNIDRADYGFYTALGMNVNWYNNFSTTKLTRANAAGMYTALDGPNQYLDPYTSGTTKNTLYIGEYYPNGDANTDMAAARANYEAAFDAWLSKSVEDLNGWFCILIDDEWDGSYGAQEWLFADMISKMEASSHRVRPIITINGTPEKYRQYEDSIAMNMLYTRTRGREHLDQWHCAGNKFPVSNALLNMDYAGASIPEYDIAGAWAWSVMKALAKGHTGISFWMDGGSQGSIALRAFYDEIAPVGAFIQANLGLLKTPPWSSGWGCSVDNENYLVETRDYGGKRYIFYASPDYQASTGNFTVTGVTIASADLYDLYTGSVVGSIVDNEFQLSGASYHYGVLRIDE